MKGGLAFAVMKKLLQDTIRITHKSKCNERTKRGKHKRRDRVDISFSYRNNRKRMLLIIKD